MGEFDHTIPNSYYVPQLGLRLLSPQHWMQATSKFKGSCTTYWDHTVLQWGDYKCTVPHDASNVVTFPLAPGYSCFLAFCTTTRLQGTDADPEAYSIQVDTDPVLKQVIQEQEESPRQMMTR